MTLPNPVKPVSILFDFHDVPSWVPPDYITDEGAWLNMAFVPVPYCYKSLLIGPDGTSLRTLGRCTSTFIEMKSYLSYEMIIIYGLERFNTRLAFNKLITQIDTIRTKLDTGEETGVISSYCASQ